MDRQGGFIGIGAKFGTHPVSAARASRYFYFTKVVIGKNAVIFQGVTIGAQRTAGSKNNGNPTIRETTAISGAGAKIIGNVKIGNNCRIGAGAVVYSDMPDNSVALCAPTRSHKGRVPDNRFFRLDDNGSTEYWNGSCFVKADI